jgi:hypothetical protein
MTAARTNGKDPSFNVIDLVEGESRHQDVMRQAETRRQDDLRVKQEHCDNEIAAVRLKAQEDLARAESKMRDALDLAEQRRLDAVIADIRNAALVASKESQTTAKTLETQVATTAEALRNRSESRNQGNFNWQQAVTIGGIVVLVLVDLKTKGVI